MSDEPRMMGEAPFPNDPRLPERAAPAGERNATPPGLPRPRALPTPDPDPRRQEQPDNNGTGQGALRSAPSPRSAPTAQNAAEAQSTPATPVRKRSTAFSEANATDPADQQQLDLASSVAAEPDEVKIGLWGSPSSGKTTFLGALRHAAGTASSVGTWAVIPGNENSKRLLINLTQTLVKLQEFPQTTLIGQEVELFWHFIGQLDGRGNSARRRRLWPRSSAATSKFLLHAIDVSGEAFGHDLEAGQLAANKKVLGHLAASQGLLYLFDPMGEEDQHNSVEYMNNTIVELHARMLKEKRLVGQYLPQHLSVCMTKFDHPRFYTQARKARLVNSGPDGMPRILDEDAKTLFNMICDGDFWQSGDERSRASAQFIRDEIAARFDPDRVRYFVSSSIGFRKPPGWRPDSGDFSVDSDDFANVYKAEGKWRIRGAVSPINVLEPLISLQQRLSGTVRTRG
jgi:hypothetical protein